MHEKFPAKKPGINNHATNISTCKPGNGSGKAVAEAITTTSI